MAKRTDFVDPGQVVNLTEMCVVHGAYRTTITKWVDQGCPILQRGDRRRGLEWEFHLPATIEWRINQAIEETASKFEGVTDGTVTTDEAKRRRAVADAIVSELEAAEALRNVVSVSLVAEKVTAQFAEVRSLLAGLGAKVAGRAAAMTSAPKIQELVDDEIRRALEPISDVDRSGLFTFKPAQGG
jgi:terminase small subunit / prophage DNA-packing protein